MEVINNHSYLVAQMVKNSPVVWRPGFIHGWGRSPGEGNGNPLQYSCVSLVFQMIKNLPAMQETWVQSLGGEDPLEKEMETHSGILAWESPWIEEPGGIQSMGLQRVGHV